VGRGAFIGWISGKLLAECLCGCRPLFALLAKQAETVTEIGEIGMVTQKLLIFRSRFVSVSLVGKDIGVELFEIRRARELLVA
jgi:hypothetical protein